MSPSFLPLGLFCATFPGPGEVSHAPHVWGLLLLSILLFYHRLQLPSCVGGGCFMKEAVGILNPPVIISEETARHGCLAAVG